MVRCASIVCLCSPLATLAPFLPTVALRTATNAPRPRAVHAGSLLTPIMFSSCAYDRISCLSRGVCVDLHTDLLCGNATSLQ
jgi:hypothetical protein